MSAASDPTPVEVAQAATAAAAIRGRGRAAPKLTVRVTNTKKEPVALPDTATKALTDVLEHLARGRAVAVVPVESEITTQQAAELLNVSRPYLVDLLEQGAIPFRKVGSRRRIRLADVLAYREIDDAKRRSAVDELTAEAQRLGLGY